MRHLGRMIIIGNGHNWQIREPLTKIWNGFWKILITIILIITFISVFIAVKYVDEIHIIIINTRGTVSPELDVKFLSVALDSSVIANNLDNLNMSNPKLLNLMKHLSPAYLRVGGTMADRLVFTTDDQLIFKNDYRDNRWETVRTIPNFTMNVEEWLAINTMAENAGMRLIFDLNVLRRFPNGSWDSRNAESLIKFSQEHDLSLDWELGNEPNNFPHKFDCELRPDQLAADFKKLRTILDKYPNYRNSNLIGPDVTRPKIDQGSGSGYLLTFLIHGGGDVLDAITWHQYYFNGRTACYADFINPYIFDNLKYQIRTIQHIVKAMNITDTPIWLGETSSAYGGGAPGYSNRFIGTFIWLDKLGIAAKLGLDIVVRQSIFQGYYALIDDTYNPNPDWWVSVLFKKIVGRRVVPCYHKYKTKVRLYCHCKDRSLTIFGMNLNNCKTSIRFFNIDDNIDSFILTTNFSLYSKNIFLNGELLALNENGTLPEIRPKVIPALPYIELPPFSLAFFVVPSPEIRCL